MPGPPKGTGSTVLNHPQIAQIELELARGVSPKNVARRYQLHKDALYRHRKSMSPQLKASLMVARKISPVDLEHLRISESEGLLQHLLALRGRAYQTLAECDELGDVQGAAALHRVLLKNIEDTARLLGELSVGPTTTINQLVISPEFLQMQHRILRALVPFPAARQAVADAFAETVQPAVEQPVPIMLEAPVGA